MSRHRSSPTESRHDQIDPGWEKVDQHSEQRPGMQGNVERQVHGRIEFAPAKEPSRQNQVSGAGDRQKLAERLHYCEHNRLVNGQWISFPSGSVGYVSVSGNILL